MIHDNPNHEDEAEYGDANDEHFFNILTKLLKDGQRERLES